MGADDKSTDRREGPPAPEYSPRAGSLAKPERRKGDRRSPERGPLWPEGRVYCR